MIADCARYVDGVDVAEPMSLRDAGSLADHTDGFVWVTLSDPAARELDELRRAFDLPHVPMDTWPDGYQRPQLERHGDRTILTVKTVRHDAAGTQLEIGAVDVVIGAHYAIAIGRSSREALDGASSRLRARPEVAALGPVGAVWAVLDAAIEASERIVDGLGDELEIIQASVFNGHQDQSEPIYLQLQEAARLARAIHPMLTIFDRLERGELAEARELSPLLGDVSDHARRLSEEVLMLGEALDGLLNANLARVTVRQNVIIQQVSAWAAIAAVVAIITGIYGMNFRHMPELGWVLGYPLAIAIMAVTVVALRWYFKRVGWL